MKSRRNRLRELSNYSLLFISCGMGFQHTCWINSNLGKKKCLMFLTMNPKALRPITGNPGYKRGWDNQAHPMVSLNLVFSFFCWVCCCIVKSISFEDGQVLICYMHYSFIHELLHSGFLSNLNKENQLCMDQDFTFQNEIHSGGGRPGLQGALLRLNRYLLFINIYTCSQKFRVDSKTAAMWLKWNV